MKIGAHVSAAISLDLAFERAEKIGAECFQIFISPPQMWAFRKHSKDEIRAFRKKLTETKIEPNFIHGAYLINLATVNPQNLKKSIEWLIYSLNMAKRLGLSGTIFHLGSHKGAGFEKVEDQICQALEEILKNTPDDTLLILENSSGSGGAAGKSFYELGRLIKLVSNPRLKICLDTQHAFAAGYDLKSLIGLKDMIAELEEEVGLKNLAVFHLNDSKTEYKSSKDRHENIGEGFIGVEAFRNIIHSQEFSKIPMILEVPGFTNSGPDKENIFLVKRLRDIGDNKDPRGV